MKTASPSTCRKSFLNSGEPSRARTCDPLIKSQLLYQLSYRPSCDARKIIRVGFGVSSKRHSFSDTMPKLTRRGALAVCKKFMHGVDETFDVGLGHECGGTGGEGFTTMNLVRVASVEDARNGRRNC